MPLTLNKAQRLGTDFLVRHQRAALFAGLGVGKTVTTLWSYDVLRMLGDVSSAMIVAPIRVCNLTWPNEVRKWPEFRHLRVANLRTKQGWKDFLTGNADIYTTNYEALPKVVKTITEGQADLADLVVFDELTRAKNPKGERVKGLRELLHQHPTVRRWGLTGTPTPEGYLDLFGQIRLLDDGKRLSPSYDHYQQTYFHPIDYKEYDWRLNEGADRLIQERIADLCLTLLSEDYGVKVPIVEEDIEITMPRAAVDQYETLEAELILSMGDDPEEVVLAPNAATLTNKLLQICGGAVYYEREGGKHVADIHSAKIEAMLKYLNDHKGQPVMLVYNYQHELTRMKKALGDRLTAFEDYKSPKAQSEVEQAWNAGRIGVLAVHPASVSHGLNLQYGPGHRIHWFSPCWSRENYDQLNARLARQGQKAPAVIVTRLLCTGTMDDAVIEALREKDTGQRALLSALKNLRLLKAV